MFSPPLKYVNSVPSLKAHDRVQIKDVQLDGHQINKDVTIIGRIGGTGDIQLPKGTISAKHAELRFKNGQFEIGDAASTNGTYVYHGALRHKLTLGERVALINGNRIVFADYDTFLTW
jgi:pSer/pThr/pTyr-binding forkhead associated (FHA) protein